MFSRNEAPVGRGLTFVPGNIQTRIRLITTRHSLLPTSQARTPMGSPCGSLSLASEGGIQGFHVPLPKYAGLGACCRPGSHGSRGGTVNANLPLPSSLSATLTRSRNDLYHRFTYVHRTRFLAITRLVASRREVLSRFSPRTPKCASVLLSGPLLIQVHRVTQ